MSRDRSLDEFVDGATSDGNDSGTESPEPADSEPLAPTYRWSADGGACSVCGEPTRERWRGDDGFVCGRCKEW